MKRNSLLGIFLIFLVLIAPRTFAKEWALSVMSSGIECTEAQELDVLSKIKSPATLSLVYVDQFLEERAHGVRGIIVTSEGEKPEFPRCDVKASTILDFCNDPTNRACIPIPSQYLEEDLQKVESGTFSIEKMDHPRFPTPLY